MPPRTAPKKQMLKKKHGKYVSTLLAHHPHDHARLACCWALARASSSARLMEPSWAVCNLPQEDLSYRLCQDSWLIIWKNCQQNCLISSVGLQRIPPKTRHSKKQVPNKTWKLCLSYSHIALTPMPGLLVGVTLGNMVLRESC